MAALAIEDLTVADLDSVDICAGNSENLCLTMHSSVNYATRSADKFKITLQFSCYRKWAS